jgi:aminoglycoside phosphotransferase (APT) family kinase protein
VHGDPKRAVFRVSTLTGRGWVVKQASPLDLTHVRLLDREAALYELARNDVWGKPLRALQPHLRAYDAGVHALIFELIAYDTGWDHLRRATVKPDALGRLIGRALASIHIVVPTTAMPTELFAPRLPWILQLDRTDPEAADQASMRAMMQLVQREPALGQALAHVAEGWQVQTFIHGDAKLDNVLVRMTRRQRLWLIDWAFAGEGDPAWDIGSVVRSCLLLWIFGIAFRRSEPLREAAQRSVFPLTLVRSFTSAFLSHYLAARAIKGKAASAFIRRAFVYAGAAMIQSALADARARERLTLRQLAMLQMSIDLIERPESAIRDLFGGGTIADAMADD